MAFPFGQLDRTQVVTPRQMKMLVGLTSKSYPTCVEVSTKRCTGNVYRYDYNIRCWAGPLQFLNLHRKLVRVAHLK